MSKFHYVYEIINSIDGKIYIGKHSTNDIDDGYMGSGKLLNRAIKKHGIENFRKRIIETFDTEEDALTYERKLVDETFVADENTYNLVLGGRSQLSTQCRGLQNSQYGTCWIFNETLRISKKIKRSEVESAIACGWMMGRRMYSLSDVARKRMGSCAGKPGHKHSLETRMKLSNQRKGKRHTEEMRKRCSLSQRLIAQQRSEHMKTLRWIHEPISGVHKRVLDEEVHVWLDVGWISGRAVGGGRPPVNVA